MGGVVNAITWPQYGKKSPLRSAVPNRFQVFKPIHCLANAVIIAVWVDILTTLGLIRRDPNNTRNNNSIQTNILLQPANNNHRYKTPTITIALPPMSPVLSWLAWKEAIGFAVWCLVVVRSHCDLIQHVLISTLIDCVVVVAVYYPECLCRREKEDDNKDMIPSVIVDSVQSLLLEQLPCKKTKVQLYVRMRSLFYVINRVNEDDRVLLARTKEFM
ncbi:hypothetical protein T07_12682 [Trichinella nelsoni]|uniref:Uncharacterized protein n=1 Tax=Trichinella nelsoni TaxID=6336 RepID=A0A0V0RGB6_9BILA|nr:hypothetical protein T07_12682 [Trichinella nelsoni]